MQKHNKSFLVSLWSKEFIKKSKPKNIKSVSNLNDLHLIENELVESKHTKIAKDESKAVYVFKIYHHIGLL